MFRSIILLIAIVIFSCDPKKNNSDPERDDIITGAEQFEDYLPLIEDKNVALLVNHTSLVDKTHLVDTLLSQEINIRKIFAPEHGFRGEADAGEHLEDMKDPDTGIPLISLYGEKRRPGEEDLNDIDIVIFDIQDVGVRFYTYISTMHYVMEACAEYDIPFIVLDRPNPNGHYVDGPVREDTLQSFVGMHPIPIVHGLTVGELAKMINGEGWLEGNKTADLTVIPVKNYTHNTRYSLPVKPSPNLPTDLAVQLYPSLCLFEGTKMSVGRGTTFPFQVVGYPDSIFGDFIFTPESIIGMDSNPKYKGMQCYGVDYRKDPFENFTLQPLMEFYSKDPVKEDFFNGYFPKLAGNFQLQEKIKAGISEDSIKSSWQADLNQYKSIRKNYLLYTDFE